MTRNNRPSIFLLSPFFGILIFVALYIWAAIIYPGGSRWDKQAQGFSLTRNYWCDLFDTVAHNGSANPSRPVAIGAMVILCLSFGLLWHLLPRLFAHKNKRQDGIRYTGISAMELFMKQVF